MNRGETVENGKWELAIAPVNTTGAGQDGDWVSMKHYRRAAVILVTGAWPGGTAAVTLEQATSAAGAGAKALAFSRYCRASDADESPIDSAAYVSVTSNTFNLSDNDNVLVIEVRAEDLDINNGFTFIRVRTATPGANADLVAGLYYLYEGDYAGQPGNLPSAVS